MIADDRGAADGVADEDGHKNELDVHQNAVGGDAVLANETQELEVVQHADQRGGDVAHQLGGAVAAGLQDGAQAQSGGTQVQQAGIGAQEVEQRQHAANTLAQSGGDGGAGHAPAEHGDEQCVQHHVGNAGGHRDQQAEAGLLCGDEKALEHVLQHEGEGEAGDDAAVEHAVGHHGVGGTQEPGDDGHGGNTHRGQHQTQQQGEQHHHGEGLLSLLVLALAQQLGDESGAAGADHEAHAAQDHDEGHDQIDGGEGCFAHEVGDEQTVHHAVDRREHHHTDGRQREAQQLTVREVVGKADGFGHKNLLNAVIACRGTGRRRMCCCRKEGGV